MPLPPLFNPSNDMALAANLRQYTPPRHIRQMEDDLRDLARLWDEGPWGWSLATKQRYRRMGIPECDLPTDEWLRQVRNLSSRQFGAEYYRQLTLALSPAPCSLPPAPCSLPPAPCSLPLAPCPLSPAPCTLPPAPCPLSPAPCSLLPAPCSLPLIPCQSRFVTSLESLESLGTLRSLGPLLIFKAPWSSSGRGNILVRGEMDDAARRRIGRIIREQGGIVVEPFYTDKALDFAMEFWVGDRETRFLGYSVFSADEMGHYGGNYVESQPSLLRRIDLPGPLLDSLIQYHCRRLSSLPYRGPVGIDMMRLSDGRVHPCVEINFRMTMGLLALLLYNKGIRDDQLLTPHRDHGFTAEILRGRLTLTCRP